MALLRGRLDGAERLTAIRLLGELRDQAATEPLAGLLADPDAPVRREAAGALEHGRDPYAIEPLLRATADPDYAVRDTALRALDGFGTAAVVWGLAAAGRGALDDITDVAEHWTDLVHADRAELAAAPATPEDEPDRP